jgi:uncharacterized protein (TIGR02680 family)
MTIQHLDGERWLGAALSSDLPGPARDRWQPLRVGIVNLWEYDDAEFWFADGRLVLRGGNGAGKTKVLELTTLMLLRGEISPSVLDPFGSQHRTMRFNLLPTGDDDDPRPPSDAGLGYAWIEFGRIDESGHETYFVCGLGLSLRRGSGTASPNRWHFVTALRPGQDFRFVTGQRPLDKKDLLKISGIDYLDTPTKYRSRLAADLFGIGSEGFDNLTSLLKELRRPKLGERLNPASLAETLRAALPPLATTEITQLADGWDNLEKLRTSVEEIRTAATRVASFNRTAWLPWARTVVRLRADAFASATSKLDNTTTARRLAEQALTDAEGRVLELSGELDKAKQRRKDLSTELTELQDSPAYQDAVSAADRVRSLSEALGSLKEQQAIVESRRTNETNELEDAAGAATEAAGQAEDAELVVSDLAESVAALARPAGLLDSAVRHLPTRDLPGLRSDLTVRRERFGRLRELAGKHGVAERAVDQAAELLESKLKDLDDARGERAAAQLELEDAADTLRTQIRDWNLGTKISKTTDEQVEDWCDLVAELAASEPDDSVTTPSAAIGQHIDEVRETIRGRLTGLVHDRGSLSGEQTELTDELSRTLADVDSAPDPPTLWQRRHRALAGQGAPFWKCVQPRAEIDLDLLEATLAAAGLLDAWVLPDGTLRIGDDTPSDTFLRPGPTLDAGNLSLVLEPTPTDGVTQSTIHKVLAGIGWLPMAPSSDDSAQTWLAADGSWRWASLSGRAEPSQPASYLGATAREAARQRRIAGIEERLGELAVLIASVNEQIEETTAELSALRAEQDRVPPERPLTHAAARVRERDRRVADCDVKSGEARQHHQRKQSDRDAAWAVFTTYAGDHAFPVRNLESYADGLGGYRGAVDTLATKVELLGVLQKQRDRADEAVGKAQRRLESTQREWDRFRDDIRQTEVRLRTAEDALSLDAKAQLARRGELDGLLAETDELLEAITGRATDARVAAAKAEETLGRHEENRLAAEQVRDTTMAAWWETYDAGLAVPAGLSAPERRTVEAARDTTRAARRELGTAGDPDRAWRTCSRELDALRQILLPDRDSQVLESETEGAVPRVVILADSTAGWQAPPAAADLLAEQVRRQEESFDAEQQRVLTTLLGSTFIEHLKDRLDYTARTFRKINDHLASHPTRHGNAVHLKWGPDPSDQDAGKVVEALGQGYAFLTPEKQSDVRAFLARKIDEARDDASADGTADWRDQLSAALDYRSWLRITLQYRPSSASKWVSFDAAKHGAKSGGEKVVLLSQPLFAAAVVAYNAAAAHAPRCVWLDEAMTGVDEEIKASFMGLTVSFDLDVMLTAHDEWCKYATVPAVAVYDLARHKGLPGVDAVPYLWCGGEWTAVDVGAAHSSADNLSIADGLFAEVDDR